MPAEDQDLADASRLLRFAMQPRLTPAQDPEYRRLVREWDGRPELQRALEAIGPSLGVWVLAVDQQAGIVACGDIGSPFELRMGDFLRQARSENQWSQRVVFAVTLVATWRLCFPQPAHLDDPSRGGRVSATEVAAYVDSICERLERAAAEAGDDVNPPADRPDLERAWRAWSRRGETSRTPDSRRSSHTRSALVGRALGWMADQGLLEKVGRAEQSETYRARPRLRILVREVAASHIYEQVVALESGPGEVPQ